MKLRILCIIAACVLLLSAAGCKGGEKPAAPVKTFYEHGLDLVELLSEMASNEEHVKLYTNSGDIKDIIAGIGSGDYSSPDAVYSVSLSAKGLELLSESNKLSGVSDGLKKHVTQRAHASLMTRFNGLSGANTLAAANICTASKTFVGDASAEDIIYIYAYGDAYPAAVTFLTGEDGAVSATGCFILFEDLDCSSLEALKLSLDDIPATVSEVPAPAAK